jgi:transcriptional regulator with XRE-family HTH domain
MANPDPATLGARMQRIRQRQNLSVRELADKAGVNKNTILRLEKGLTPSYATLNRVCEALGIHIAQLTQPEPDENEPVTHPAEELVFCLRGTAKLTVAGREYLLNEGDAATFWSSERHSYAPATDDDEKLPVLLLIVWLDSRDTPEDEALIGP